MKQHEKVLPHQKHDSHSILADYGTDQNSNRINDKVNNLIVKPLDLYINNLYFLMILMLLVMMMIIYTLVFQNLLLFQPIIKPMILIKHPLSHVQTVLLHSRKQKLFHYQLLSLIQLNLLNSLHILLKSYRFKSYFSSHTVMTLSSLSTRTTFKVSSYLMIFH